jgi:alanyl-tRNA synthetase
MEVMDKKIVVFPLVNFHFHIVFHYHFIKKTTNIHAEKFQLIFHPTQEMITTDDLRKKWLEFWQSKQHAIIPSASILPDNDPSALFHNSGMHPLVRYLAGENHPAGKRLANTQKCIRTGDIDEVGDATHLTFFEMLGNWSLGDYFKEKQIGWSFEFLIEVLELPLEKLAVSVFEGDNNASRDNEAAQIWKSAGMPAESIAYLPASENWWAKGETGPCGPDTEIFYWTGDEAAPKSFQDSWDDHRWVEIWNNVFMQFDRQKDGSITPLQNQNIDTGMGLERTVAILNGKKSVYETDAFASVLQKISTLANYASILQNPLEDAETANSIRIIADHIRTSSIMIADGVTPSNTDQGYILRRLIRRAVRHGRKIEIKGNFMAEVAIVAVEKLGTAYPELKKNQSKIIKEINGEEEQFAKTLISGEKEFKKMVDKTPQDEISGTIAFHIYETYGFPLEMTVELAAEYGKTVDIGGFKAAESSHKAKSRAGAEKKFKGGLADDSVEVRRLHTATHLLHAGLRKVLGDHAAQKGSNITTERLRFDFSHGAKLTVEELSAVEKYANDAIAANAPITYEEMDLESAYNGGAIGLFGEKYGDKVKVYTMGTWSKEICGGPHAQRTGELGTFKIKKQESCGKGVRRIKAVLV